MKLPRCLHCRKPFQPDIHNAWHQRYCTSKDCQLARNRASCRKWRIKNPEYFKKDTQRSQNWRKEHPYYWRHERRKIFSSDILMPVCRSSRNGVGMRILDRDGVTLRHVVIAETRDWRAVWRDVGVTLQNVVHGLGFQIYRRRNEWKECHIACSGRRWGYQSRGPD